MTITANLTIKVKACKFENVFVSQRKIKPMKKEVIRGPLAELKSGLPVSIRLTFPKTDRDKNVTFETS